MHFFIDINEAQKLYPEFQFVAPLTPSAQKCAFHVRDSAGRNLCLKVISPSYSLDRLEREIRAMQTIRHKNVVALLEYTFSSKVGNSRHFLTEEFIEGSDLSMHLVYPWPLQKAARVFEQILEGLVSLAAANIVHRDLKPSNIRLRPDDTPVIIDFGLSRHLSLPDLTDTGDGAQIGTATYFSPEQFCGNKYDIDCRTDLFAVGIMLYEAVVGKHPFYVRSMSRGELQKSICESDEFRRDPTFLALPEIWQTFIIKLLARERHNRPLNAATASRVIGKLGVVI